MDFGCNNIIWILFIILLMPNGFGGGCGCNSFCDSSIIILIVFLLLMQNNNNCGICEAK